MNSQNTLASTMEFHTVLLLTKELTLQPTVVESTGFTMFPTVLK